MSYDKKTFNPKKHADQRRKRPVYKPGQVPKAKFVELQRTSQDGVVHTKFKLMVPMNPQGFNRSERLSYRSKFKHGRT